MQKPSDCDDEPSIPSCRICMEPGTPYDDLVQPCACAGTQAWIHIGCLKRWQQSSPNRSRKAICPVCKAAYAPEFVPREKPPASVSPLSLPYNWVRNAIAMASLGFANIFCNEPVIMIVILVIMFIGCLDWSLPALFGLRLCMLVDGDGTPSLRLVRVGSNIQGLAAGALLVATDAIRGGIFDRAVVVITRHDEEGTAGYLINCPIERIRTNHPVFESGAPLRHALATPEDPFAVSHGLGGPVGLDTWVVLHAFENVPGATRLGSGLHVGGDLATLRERARASLLDQRGAVDGAEAQQADARGAQAGAADGAAEVAAAFRADALHVRGEVDAASLWRSHRWVGTTPRERTHVLARALHGHSSWAPGQLEGEIRSGLWKWGAGQGYEFALTSAGWPLADARPDYRIWHKALAVLERAQVGR